MELGSPVYPKTPKAMALHYIDARLEPHQIPPHEAARGASRVRPFQENLIKPLQISERQRQQRKGELAVTTLQTSQIGHTLILPLITMALLVGVLVAFAAGWVGSSRSSC